VHHEELPASKTHSEQSIPNGYRTCSRQVGHALVGILSRLAALAGVDSPAGGGSRLEDVDDDEPVLSIGELAKRAGLPVRTIRFWPDIGVVPPVARTESGRRLYDAECVARLALVATLRELGLGLADVRRVLDGRASIAEVAAVHLDALDAQIRALGRGHWLGSAGGNAEAAVLRGCPPDSAEAAQVVHRILERAPVGHQLGREELLARLEVVTDPRIDRYWQLTATVNGWPPFPSHMPASVWLLAALRAHE
jgi:DNA-binding transcriptional MerR regulator